MRIFHISEDSNDPVDVISSRLLVNLTREQALAIRDEIKRTGGERPSPSEYDKASRRIKSISIPNKEVSRWGVPTGLRNVNVGFDLRAGDIRLAPGFDPKIDIPAGWGLYSLHDGGNNYRCCNAARLVWTHLWNFWWNYVKEDTMDKYAQASGKTSNNLMEVVCAWCQKLIDKKPADKSGVTHTICDTCSRELLNGLETSVKSVS